MFPAGIISTVDQEPAGCLVQEASARDLWNPDPQKVIPADHPAAAAPYHRQQQFELQPNPSENTSADPDSCFVTPHKSSSAWGDKSTPPSVGSSKSHTMSKQPSPQNNTPNAWGQRTSQSPSFSHFSRHSAPAAMTPASKTGKASKNRRVSPVPMPPEERSFSAALAGSTPGQTAFAKASPAWSGTRTQHHPASAGNGAMSCSRLSGVHPALESGLASPSTPNSINPCDAIGGSNLTPFSLAQQESQHSGKPASYRSANFDSPNSTTGKQCWSTPPLAQRSRSGKSQRGSSLGSTGWQVDSPSSSHAQANTQHSSPGSTATSKPTWAHVGSQGTQVPMTPPSQACSQADSTDTCYATPGSTIRLMPDFSHDSPVTASPAGSVLVTPCSNRIEHHFAAKAAVSSPELQAGPSDQVPLPEDVAAARMSQAGAELLVETADSSADKESTRKVIATALPEIAPVLSQQAGTLAELHATILASELLMLMSTATGRLG